MTRTIDEIVHDLRAAMQSQQTADRLAVQARQHTESLFEHASRVRQHVGDLEKELFDAINKGVGK